MLAVDVARPVNVGFELCGDTCLAILVRSCPLCSSTNLKPACCLQEVASSSSASATVAAPPHGSVTSPANKVVPRRAAALPCKCRLASRLDNVANARHHGADRLVQREVQSGFMRQLLHDLYDASGLFQCLPACLQQCCAFPQHLVRVVLKQHQRQLWGTRTQTPPETRQANHVLVAVISFERSYAPLVLSLARRIPLHGLA